MTAASSTIRSFRDVRLRLQLYQLLRQAAAPFVCFGRRQDELDAFVKIPFCQGAFVLGVAGCFQNLTAETIFPKKRRRQPSDAQVKPGHVNGESAGTAVFLFNLELVPADFIRDLEEGGCREFIYREGDELRKVDCSGSRGGLSRWLRRFRALRRMLLRTLGTQLCVNVDPAAMAQGTECYRARLPEEILRGCRTGSGDNRILLFEDGVRLEQLGESPAEIDRVDSGRYYRQGDELLFASTDNSNPADNGRRYSLISLRNSSNWLDRFFYPLAEPVGRERMTDRAFEGLVSSLKRADCRLGVQHLGESSDSICLYSSNLGPGGTERQIAYVARHLTRLRYNVQILTCEPLSDTTLHYHSLLGSNDFYLDSMRNPHPHFSEETLSSTDWGQKTLELFVSMPDYMAEAVWNLYTHLMVLRPQVLHCWLDYPNVIGGLAGWLAGVPQVILSTRNLNPRYFPRFFHPWYRIWYKFIVTLPKIKLIGNSEAGIDDYAAWLDIPRDRFALVRNGIDFSIIHECNRETIASFKKEFEIDDTTPVIAGIFRLDVEKRPFFFLEVVKAVKARVPSLRVLIAGVGMLDEALRKAVNDCAAADWITLLGRRTDVPVIISCSDLVLLTSEVEGTPNALMEAQALGTPVVCAGVGGVSEVVGDKSTGFVLDKDDLEGMVESCCRILGDTELKHRLGAAGRELMHSRFPVDKMVESTLACYGIGATEGCSIQ